MNRFIYFLPYCYIQCSCVTVGGSVTAGLGIYDTMQYVLPPVATWCVGQAASMASLLLTAGSPGMRHSLPNSRIMIHQPSGHAVVSSTRLFFFRVGTVPSYQLIASICRYFHLSVTHVVLTLYRHIKTAEQRAIIQQYGDWYTGH